jgi:PAS domain S-box-containing protein
VIQKTYDEILNEEKLPAVAISEQGVFIQVNKSFERAYGWKKQDLIGRTVTQIMPPFMRDAHNFGFSRFLTTEAPRILNTPLDLPILCKNGKILSAQHFIVGQKRDGAWHFAAIVKLKNKKK